MKYGSLHPSTLTVFGDEVVKRFDSLGTMMVQCSGFL